MAEAVAPPEVAIASPPRPAPPRKLSLRDAPSGMEQRAAEWARRAEAVHG